MFGKVGLGHVVVDFPAFADRDVGRRVLAFLLHVLGEQWVDFTQRLAIQCTLHYVGVLQY